MHQFLLLGYLCLERTNYNTEVVMFTCLACVGKTLSSSSPQTHIFIKRFDNVLISVTRLVYHVGHEGWSYLKAGTLTWICSGFPTWSKMHGELSCVQLWEQRIQQDNPGVNRLTCVLLLVESLKYICQEIRSGIPAQGWAALYSSQALLIPNLGVV